MNQAETFEWLRQRSNRLDAAEAELIKCKLELARLTVKPIVDAEKRGEDLGNVMNMQLRVAAGTYESCEMYRNGKCMKV